jgi:hypothetical protein
MTTIPSASGDRERAVSSAIAPPPQPAAFRLSIALAVVTAAAAIPTFLVEDILRGPAVMNGSARGTALILTIVTIPVLIWAMWATAHGSSRASFVWIGTVAHVLYQSVLFLFATPFNELFLLYVGMLGLGIWSAITLLARLDATAARAQVSSRAPRRGIAVYIWVVVVLNALVWIRSILPALAEADRPRFLVGTGLTTNPIYVQDLAFWLPLMAVAAWWLWHDRPWGHVVAGSMLVTWLVEAITVATDQWMGHEADPASDVATLGGAYLFLVMTVVGAIAVAAYFRHVGARGWDRGPDAEVRSTSG